MNSRNLMIADIVYAPMAHPGFARVCGLGLFAVDILFEDGVSAEMVPEDELSPVMLSPELLVKAGFVYKKGLFFSSWTLSTGNGTVVIDAYQAKNGGNVLYTEVLGNRKPLNFVHELQNLMRYCGMREEADTMLTGGSRHGR